MICVCWSTPIFSYYVSRDASEHVIDYYEIELCVYIKLASPVLQENKNKCKYSDIFSNDVNKMNDVAELLLQALRAREKLLTK